MKLNSAKTTAKGTGVTRTSKAHHTAKGKNAPTRSDAKDNNFGKVKKATGKSFKSMVRC